MLALHLKVATPGLACVWWERHDWNGASLFLKRQLFALCFPLFARHGKRLKAALRCFGMNISQQAVGSSEEHVICTVAMSGQDKDGLRSRWKS